MSPRFANLPAYIQDVTHEIWEGRQIASLRQSYGRDMVMRRDAIAREGGTDGATRPFTPDQDRPDPYSGIGNDHPLGQRLAGILTRIMEADISVIDAEYDRAVHVWHAGGVTGWGIPFAEAEWLQLRAAFPSATFTIHHRIGRDDRGERDRAAIRWSLDGIHDGHGRFGPPTGAPVHIMGFTHAEFGPWGLRREWSLWDESRSGNKFTFTQESTNDPRRNGAPHRPLRRSATLQDRLH